MASSFTGSEGLGFLIHRNSQPHQQRKKTAFVKKTYYFLSFFSFLQTCMCDSRPGDDSRWDTSSWSEHQLCQQSSVWIHNQQTRWQVGYLYGIYSVQSVVTALLPWPLKRNSFQEHICYWCLLKILVHYCWFFWGYIGLVTSPQCCSLLFNSRASLVQCIYQQPDAGVECTISKMLMVPK